jgi:hypothetical protein
MNWFYYCIWCNHVKCQQCQQHGYWWGKFLDSVKSDVFMNSEAHGQYVVHGRGKIINLWFMKQQVLGCQNV